MKEKEKRRGRGRGGFKPRSSKTRYGTLDFCMETEFMYGFDEIMYEFPCLVGL